MMTALHVLLAVFAVGPMAMLPQLALRGIREDSPGMVAGLARATFVFSIVSAAVVVFGFGALGTRPDWADWSFSSLWIWLSLVLWALAVLITVLVVVPGLRDAADALRASAGSSAGAGTADARAGYGKIAAANGIATLMLVAVVVLMVVKP
nr:DUF2269 family protein [Nakamurella aerolata]